MQNLQNAFCGQSTRISEHNLLAVLHTTVISFIRLKGSNLILISALCVLHRDELILNDSYEIIVRTFYNHFLYTAHPFEFDELQDTHIAYSCRPTQQYNIDPLALELDIYSLAHHLCTI